MGLRVLDLFSGIGGFSLAFLQEGFEVRTAIDLNPKACEIYKRNLQKVNVICDDIEKIDLNQIEDFDILISTIMVQRFSVARRNSHKSDDILGNCLKELIKLKNPRVFVLEAPNRKLADIDITIDFFERLNYKTQWFEADSEEITGRPLIEKKRYIIGIKEDLKINSIEFNYKTKEKLTFYDFMEKEVNIALYSNKINDKKNIIINANTDRLACNYVNVPWIDSAQGIRRVTIREYARLKGFPDDFVFEDKHIWQMYRMILTSTNVSVARLIAKKLREILCENLQLDNQVKIVPEKDSLHRNLTNSKIDRQNILNNELALQEIRNSSNIKGIIFENKICFTKNMVADFFDVDIRTIERYVATNEEELIENGYEILKGKRLRDFKDQINESGFSDDEKNNLNSKITQLAIFDFRTFLNIGMLLVESENAKILRQTMLAIVIDFINKKTGGSTTYINQRDKAFLSSFLQEDDYRKEFTDALRDYVDMGNFKYALFTDKIYQSIFKENAKEYREILKLKKKDKTRETFYSEILELIASYECGLAVMIKEESESKGRKLTNWEVQDIFNSFEKLPHWKPLIISARTKMASRDLALRDAFHQQLESYIRPLQNDEYERFLGSEADQIAKLMDENSDVLKRLKERE